MNYFQTYKLFFSQMQRHKTVATLVANNQMSYIPQSNQFRLPADIERKQGWINFIFFVILC